MNDETATLEEFLSRASHTLQDIDQKLSLLAQDALNIQSVVTNNVGNGHASVTSDSEYLQELSQHLLRLAAKSEFIQKALHTKQDVSQLDDNHWPRIRILQSQEEERAQLARELEDGVGQLLANAIFELASCRHLLAGGQDSVSEGLDALQAELEQGLTDIRHFITNLEPAAILSNFGLGEGIRRYLEQYETQTGLTTQLRIQTNIGRLPSIMENAIFRVLQEALINVHRHANASQVDVIVEEDQGVLQFSVVDNGDGLVSEKLGNSRRNLGLARMVDYAELLHGKLKVLSEPGHGTQVILRVAYPTL